jgi:hypothetical protein
MTVFGYGRRLPPALVAALTLAGLVLAGCTAGKASPASHDVIYEVEETKAPAGETVTISYVDESGHDQQETTYDTTWSKRFTTQDSLRQQAILSARGIVQGADIGTFTCIVTIDGVDHSNKDISACYVAISLANGSPIA